MIDCVSSARNSFHPNELVAKEKIINVDYKNMPEPTRIHNTQITFSERSQKTVQLNGKEKFRQETFIPIIDLLYAHLKNRSVAYQEIVKRLSYPLITTASERLTKY